MDQNAVVTQYSANDSKACIQRD